MELKNLCAADDVLTSGLENICGGLKSEPIKIYCKAGTVILQPDDDGDE